MQWLRMPCWTVDQPTAGPISNPGDAPTRRRSGPQEAIGNGADGDQSADETAVVITIVGERQPGNQTVEWIKPTALTDAG